jgi:hypothetical protein
MKKPTSHYEKTLKPRAIALGLLLVLPASLFASMYVSQSGVFQTSVLSTGSYEPVYTATGWNVTLIGTAGAVSIGNGVMFNDDFVFWRALNSTDFAITAFSVSSYTFRDVWNSNNSLPDGNGVDMKIINNCVYAEYTYSIGSGGSRIAIVWTSDLNTWAQYCDFKSILRYPESFCKYTGPGPFNGMIEYGGYVTGTCAAICTWNNTGNSEIVLFQGTVYGSDDVCFLTMLNSTCMIGGDCSPSDIIYTNDGQNWTDEYSPSELVYTSQYPFVWGWAVYVSNGIAYVAEEDSQYGYYGLYNGGVMTWRGAGTTAAFDYNMIVESISNGLVGGSGRLWTDTKDYGGPAVVYQYNSDGSLGSLVWSSSYSGTVKDLTYDPESVAWYAAVFSIDSQDATIIKITEH